jgi:DNA-binding HxlR family transcriptional regulator
MVLLDLLDRRWALRVIWEPREEALTFRELQARCEGMSSSVLSQRLRELRDAGVVTLEQSGGYGLTEQGAALMDALAPLQRWATDWAGAEWQERS